MTKDEREMRDIVGSVLRAQINEVREGILRGLSLMAVPSELKPWDERVVEAVRPIWRRIFEEGGRRAFASITRRRRHGKNWKFTPVNVVCGGAVIYRASDADAAIALPEWIEDPEVLRAIEREQFRFARQINSTTANALREELLEGMENGETISQLSRRISGLAEEWQGTRAEMIARTETARAYSKGRIEAWSATGVVERKVWHAADDACPFCLKMNGTECGLRDTFADKGDVLIAETDENYDLQMNIGYADVEGPPLHPNCRCALLAILSEKRIAAHLTKGEVL